MNYHWRIRDPDDIRRWLAAMVSTLVAWTMLAPIVMATNIDFSRDVLPILADKCYACHGPDASQREADLRLDDPQQAELDRGGYRVIVPGKPDESELIRRIMADSTSQMPPADYRKQLSESEREVLVEWIRLGAQRPAHWAYVSPRRHTTPLVTNRGWCENFIDAFVLAELEKRSIEPSPEADRRTLARRLSFDLTGLPPSPDTVQRFVSDRVPGAYDRLVDELLQSPHFGERMAVYWLDLVRYADTVGYHGDQNVSISPYRDYVISAFNGNKPFDQFTIEQLAGDLLVNPSVEHLVASGYNRLGMMSAEGGVQPEEYLAKYAADRVRNAATVWLGSTLECAECHDHKFDPFTTRDFYRFEAFFADIKEQGLYSGAHQTGKWGPSLDIADPQLPALLACLDEQLAAVREQLKQDWPGLDRAQLAWEHEQLEMLAAWRPVVPAWVRSEQGTELEVQQDGSVLAKGKLPNQDVYELQFELTGEPVRWLRIEAMPHESLPHSGPGRANNGNFVITEIRLTQLADGQEKAIELTRADADFEQADSSNKNPFGGWKAEAAIDGDEFGENWGWAVLPHVGKPHALSLRVAEPLGEGRYRLSIQQRHSNPKHLLGRFALHVAARATPATSIVASLPGDVRQALRVPADDRTGKQRGTVRSYFRSIAPETAELRQTISNLERRREDLIAEHTRSTLITESVKPRTIRVLPRGNWMDKSGEIVDPQTPEFLPPMRRGEGRATRLDLAKWLVSRENPLTARVMVNRLWKIMFGKGLSARLDDFGSQGEVPSHPELLDTLAVEFMESGWDIKHMLRLMAKSATYRQSSLPRPDLHSVDPYNRLLARQNRFRLDAEFIRDNALICSGLLVRQLGGRSVKPYQPDGLYEHLNFPKRKYVADSGPNQYRRGVYTHWQRQFLHPALKAFDAPSREACTAERPVSNTPLSALVLLNDPSYVEAARDFAQRALAAAPGAPEQRAAWMVRTAIGREPTNQEVTLLVELVRADAARFAEQPDRIDRLLEVGQSTPLPGVDRLELASWTSAARAIFNMHEFITRN